MQGYGDQCRLWLCVYVSVDLCVRVLKEKRLELSTPNLVRMYLMKPLAVLRK